MVQPVYNLTLQTQIQNVSGITAAEVASSGFITTAQVHASGYVRNKDLVGSGYIRDINGVNGTSLTIVGSGGVAVWKDGQTIQISAPSGAGGSGVSLGEVQTDLQTSGFVAHSELLASGFLKHQDLLTSGYVRSINGLNNTPSIVGSGGVTIWNDGTTIQIAATAGAGDATYASLHTSGYIRNVDFVSSGFQKASDITASGYVKHSEILVSGFAKLQDLLGSGFKPESQTDHGTITGLLDNDHPQYILNSAFIGSGFITKAEVASSGFLTSISNPNIQVSGKYHLDITRATNNLTSYSNFTVGSSTSGNIPRMRVTEPAAAAAYGGKIMFSMPPAYVSGQNFNAEVNLQAASVLDATSYFQIKVFEVPSGTGTIGTTNLIEGDGITQYTLNGQSLLFFNGIASGLSPKSQLIVEYYLHWPNGAFGSSAFVDVKTIAFHLPIYGVAQ